MNLKQKQEYILKGNVYKTIFILSIPIMINNLIQTLYNLVDGLWVSKIGSVPFAAIAFVWPINFLFISIGAGLSIAGTSIMAQLLGAGEREKTNEYASQLIVLSVLAGIVLSIAAIALTPYLLRFMGISNELLYYANTYLQIVLLDLPFTYFFFIFNSIMSSQGNTVMPTSLSAISAVSNMILDPIFIFVFKMGIGGAALATVLSKVLLAVLGAIVLFRNKDGIKPKFKNFKFDKTIIKNSLKIAIPSTIGQSGSSIGFIVLNTFIVSYGTSTMAAFGMVNRITDVISQPAMGIGTALVAMIGQNLGAKNYSRVKESFKKAILSVTAIGTVGCIIMILNRVNLINIFVPSKEDVEVISQGVTYLIFISFSMPLMGIFSVLQGLFQGSGHTKYAMALEISRLWFIRIPMILFFKNFTNIGSIAIWFSMSFSNLLTCIFGFVIYKKGEWLEKIRR